MCHQLVELEWTGQRCSEVMMGFKIKAEGGQHIPIVTCDACGTVIREYGMGGVVFLWATEGDTVPIRVLCKYNDCLANDPAEAWQERGN